MSVSRRSFIHKSIAAGTLFPLFSMDFKKDSYNLKERNKDENYWKKVADMYHQNVKL